MLKFRTDKAVFEECGFIRYNCTSSTKYRVDSYRITFQLNIEDGY